MGRHDQIDTAAPPATPFIWPELSPLSEAELLLATKFPPKLPQLKLPFGEKVTLLLDGPAAAEALDQPLTLSLYSETLALKIHAPKALVDRVCDLAGLLFEVATLTDETLALVMEHMLREPLVQFEDRLGLSARLYPSEFIAKGTDSPARLGMTIAIPNGPSHPIIIEGDASAMMAVRELFAEVTHQPSVTATCKTVPFSLTVVTPDLEVSSRDFADLTVGDALMLPPEWTTPPAAWVQVADTLRAPIKEQGGKLQMHRPFGPIHDKESKEADMTDQRPLSKAEATPITDGLPVQVSLELSRTEIRLAELGRLAPGSILPFDGPLPDTVRLIANGAAFAEGELVNLGDRIGVRLTTRL